MAGHNGHASNYEQKFSGFIELCAKPEEIIVVHHPQVLGDTYEEIVESLNRLADAEKKLVIVPRKERGKPSSPTA
jgi:hypothetical protein